MVQMRSFVSTRGGRDRRGGLLVERGAARLYEDVGTTTEFITVTAGLVTDEDVNVSELY